jgi:hypothetical protein
MSVIQVVPDRFGVVANSLQQMGNAVAQAGAVKNFIRRPTRGIEIKEDTFATIRVAAASGGKNISLVDAGSRRTDPTGKPITVNGKTATDIYSNFLLQQVHEERMEKQQILETFGEPYIFLFGERARVITFQGILVNTFDFNWEAEWWYNYDNFMRGTKCVENDARAFISYDQTIVGGYIIQAGATKMAMEPYHVSFTFQIFVTSYSNFSHIGDSTAYPGFPSAGESPTFTPVSDEATAAQFRPNLIPAVQSTQSSGGIVNGPTTLAAGLEASIQQVTNTWNQVQQQVNSVVAGINNLLNGDTVRVPYGFAGTMAFDATADSQLFTVGFGESINYTTFQDNEDEYVGIGDQYGSSSTSLQLVANLGFDDQDAQLTYDQGLVNTARQTWQDAGFDIPSVQLGPVSSFIVSKGLGLLAVGASSAWTLSSHTAVPGSADPPFAAGLGAASAFTG